jgi:hypothetical protein
LLSNVRIASSDMRKEVCLCHGCCFATPSLLSAVIATIDLAFRNHDILTEKMHELAAGPSGPNALFYHHAHLIRGDARCKNHHDKDS